MQLVCKKWHRIASTPSLHPNTILVTEHSNPRKVFYLLTNYSGSLSTIEFQDIHESRIIATLNLKRWLNLETLSIKWNRHVLDPRLPISCLNWTIDQCPKLRGVELRECFVYGDTDALLQKIQQRGIREITFMNTYLVVNGIEKLFGLRNMCKFRVHCYSFCHYNTRSLIRTFCRYNRHTLRNLGLRVNNSSSESDDVIANSIGTCHELQKLHLIGTFKISAQGLKRIAGLPKLRYLKIELRSINCNEFAAFLNLPFTRRLTGLALYWSRQADEEELRCIAKCCNLTKLSLSFSEHCNEHMISDTIIELVKKLPLRKLKIMSSFTLIPLLPRICSNADDLFYIKLVQNYNLSGKNALSTHLDLISAWYEYKYFTCGSELQVILRKRVRCSLNSP